VKRKNDFIDNLIDSVQRENVRDVLKRIRVYITDPGVELLVRYILELEKK